MKKYCSHIVFAILVLSVALIALLHYITPGHQILYHDTYRRLSYFPIAIGAILYGFQGGLCLALLSCAAFVPHLYKFWAGGPQAYYSELSEILFYMAAGIVIGLISSREKRLQEKYKSLSEALSDSYQRLHDQAAKLIEAEKQLSRSRKLSFLGHISASLAHEIKNPLAAIKGTAEILADDVPEGHPKFEFVQILRLEISRLNRSVEDVLNYCRGEKPLKSGPMAPLNDIMSRVEKLTSAGMKQKKVQFEMEIDQTAGAFRVDASGMTQVLMNVLLNSVDAVDDDGIIRLSAVALPGGGCRINIEDSGSGISEEQAKKIFEPFVTFKNGGTGLGLSISKRMMETLGGTIETTASKLGGAGFMIVLPTDHKGISP